MTRTDSKFYVSDFLKLLETESQNNYINALKMYPTIIRELQSQKTGWGLQARWRYTGLVEGRKNIEMLTISTGNLSLFDEPAEKYCYSLYVTNLICLQNKYGSATNVEQTLKIASKN